MFKIARKFHDSETKVSSSTRQVFPPYSGRGEEEARYLLKSFSFKEIIIMTQRCLLSLPDPPPGKPSDYHLF